MRFSTRGRAGRGRGRRSDPDAPMAFTESGPIAPNGPLARAYRFRNRRRNIFGKRVTIPLPVPGTGDTWTSANARAAADARDTRGPFDADNEEVESEIDAEPLLVDRTLRARITGGANVAAAPPTPFESAEDDHTDVLDADNTAFLQTGVVTRASSAASMAAGRPWVPTVPVPAAAIRAGDTTLYRVDPRAARTRHRNPHFHHTYRDAVAAQEAADVDLYDAQAQARAASFVQTRERQARARDARRNAVHTAPSGLALPAPGAPRPHAAFPEPPLNLDAFDPFGGRHTRVPDSPSRPVPPPMPRGPARHATPNPKGSLLASTFLATHATAKQTTQRNTQQQNNKQKKQTQQQTQAQKAAAAAKAAAKAVAEAKAKAAADKAKADAKKAAADKAKTKAKAKALATAKAKAAKAEAQARAAAASAQAHSVALAQLQAQQQAAATAGVGAGVDMAALLQRLQADAGVSAGALNPTVSPAAVQLDALRRIEFAVKAAEERVALQAQVDALQAQVGGLLRARQLQLQQQQPQQQQQPAPVAVATMVETGATAAAEDESTDADAAADDASAEEWGTDESEADAEADAEAEGWTEEESTDAAAETEGEAEAEAEAETAGDESAEGEGESEGEWAESEAQDSSESESESESDADASSFASAPASAEDALAAAEAAADADAAAQADAEWA